MEKINKKITELIGSNPEIAKTLHFLGIHFYDYSEYTLEEICNKRGIEPETIVEILNKNTVSDKVANLDLELLPLELVIEYLKHNHYVFIKDKLNYISKLIEGYQGKDNEVIEDLKFVFPHFTCEFIEHIYEEEDSLFAYILQICKSLKNDPDKPGIPKQFANFSISHFSEAHKTQDNEMHGIKEITDNYKSENIEDLHARLIFQELKNFAEELKIHARIENEILFPKALALEKELNQRLEKTSI